MSPRNHTDRPERTTVVIEGYNPIHIPDVHLPSLLHFSALARDQLSTREAVLPGYAPRRRNKAQDGPFKRAEHSTETNIGYTILMTGNCTTRSVNVLLSWMEQHANIPPSDNSTFDLPLNGNLTQDIQIYTTSQHLHLPTSLLHKIAIHVLATFRLSNATLSTRQLRALENSFSGLAWGVKECLKDTVFRMIAYTYAYRMQNDEAFDMEVFEDILEECTLLKRVIDTLGTVRYPIRGLVYLPPQEGVQPRTRQRRKVQNVAGEEGEGEQEREWEGESPEPSLELTEARFVHNPYSEVIVDLEALKARMESDIREIDELMKKYGGRDERNRLGATMRRREAAFQPSEDGTSDEDGAIDGNDDVREDEKNEGASEEEAGLGSEVGPDTVGGEVDGGNVENNVGREWCVIM